MFTKRTEKEATAGVGPAKPRSPVGGGGAQEGRPPATASALATVVGSDLSIRGNLESKGEVQIDGAIDGDVNAQRIVVGQEARIKGNLMADDVVVRGAVAGSIRGNKVTLLAASHVEGDIVHGVLAIERGAYFEGKSRRAADPAAVAVPIGGRPQTA